MLNELGSKLRKSIDFLALKGGASAAACMTALCMAAASPALAGSVTQPGETIGLAVGAPLPEGVYFVDTFDWGVREGPNGAPDTTLAVNIPVVAWATPAKVLGARVQLLAALPALAVGVQNSDYTSGIYNPFLAGQLAWDLGNGLGVSYLLGVYLPVGNKLGFDSTSINQRLGISYTADDWNLTANTIYGIHTRSESRTINPDFLNIDVTATKNFGKWTVGPVGFASWDLNKPTSTYEKQSQVALGALVGYNFEKVILQGYLTRTVHEDNYGGNDTRAWGRLIIPF
ncbi:transporter [Azospirillum isscasi]|uniref:Transporter n=1 Tax=Azospirillum isscasi TaxID=3053926 RepID=A0ABU0WKN3_9PROT|nr:transporter [Azospirillum isscasi]MDQ2104775.1 transporter [Azospirillum isscasi]